MWPSYACQVVTPKGAASLGWVFATLARLPVRMYCKQFPFPKSMRSLSMTTDMQSPGNCLQCCPGVNTLITYPALRWADSAQPERLSIFRNLICRKPHRMGYYLLDSQKQHDAKCRKKGGGVTLIYVIPPKRVKNSIKGQRIIIVLNQRLPARPNSPVKTGDEGWTWEIIHLLTLVFWDR